MYGQNVEFTELVIWLRGKVPDNAILRVSPVLPAALLRNINSDNAIEHHRFMDIALATREGLFLLSEVCSLADEFWESNYVLFSSCYSRPLNWVPGIAEHIIVPCLRIISQACTPPKPDAVDRELGIGKSASAAQLKDENNSNTSGSLS
ncbi:hypothetical protein GH714_031845 [Hevea brasiliensis]|uniref:Uncharacterized protein n=1 Tax=Hevea brasiliensis TaxID=3981 RepID=A0A6A6LEG8_HEVBR|nr:hypothetical protein GH714_031845 [Hevea brasiliensis]